MGTNVGTQALIWAPCSGYSADDVSPAAIIGKPLETMGQQSYGAVAAQAAMLAGLQFGKPRETVGRKAKTKGAKARFPRAKPARLLDTLHPKIIAKEENEP